MLLDQVVLEADALEVEPDEQVRQEVDGHDGHDVPLELAEHQQLPALEQNSS